MLIFLSETSAKAPNKHEFKRSAKQFDNETCNFNFSLFQFFLNFIIFTKITRKVFGKNITPLSKHLNNITNHWFPPKIKLINTNFCLLLQSLELQPTITSTHTI